MVIARIELDNNALLILFSSSRRIAAVFFYKSYWAISSK